MKKWTKIKFLFKLGKVLSNGLEALDVLFVLCYSLDWLSSDTNSDSRGAFALNFVLVGSFLVGRSLRDWVQCFDLRLKALNPGFQSLPPFSFAYIPLPAKHAPYVIRINVLI